MSQLQAVAWVLSLCTDLRKSQAKTLAHLTAATLRVGRVSLAAIGRKLTGPSAAKHRIKRTWRFCANQRVVIADAMRGLVRHLLKRRRAKPGKYHRQPRPLLIALDWTDVRNFHTLMAAAVMKGRAVPLLWATYTKWKLAKSQNNLEEGLLWLLRDLIPQGAPVILLADRGFGRTELAKVCRQLDFRYVVRIKPDVWVEGPQYCGLLKKYPVKKGMAVVWQGVRYRKEDPVTQHVVIRWKEGLPKKRDEPWYLMTDLKRSAVALTALYGQRMTVEELFRDDKSKRNGFSLRHTKITKPGRIDRLLLILALAYWLLCGIGLLAQERYRPGQWCSSNDPQQCSVFTIGRIMIDEMEVKAPEAFSAVARAVEEAAPKWG
jgi:DDE family transposase